MLDKGRSCLKLHPVPSANVRYATKVFYSSTKDLDVLESLVYTVIYDLYPNPYSWLYFLLSISFLCSFVIFKSLIRSFPNFYVCWKSPIYALLAIALDIMTEKPRPDSPKAQYLYQSITEPRHIRVLRLQQGVWTDPLRCTLYQAHIDETPTYEALSYVWGDPTPKHTLICEGQEMPIAENLHTALLYLRHEDNPCWLWIDAICINQQDIEERNRQVRLMSEIYYEAGRAVIWLGEEDETTTEGVAILERLEQKVIDAQSYVPLRFDFDEPDFELDETLNGASEQSLPLRNILKRPWFSRMWILQEVSIARAALVLCGRKTIPWSIFDRACSYLGVAPRQDLELDTTFVETMNIVYGDGTKGLVSRDRSKYLPLLDLLFLTSQHGDATDSRDKVYSLLGIAAEGLYNELSPDYALSVEDVYTKTARTIIRSSGSLQILSFPEDNPLTVQLPSWVPDWRRRSNSAKRSPLGYQTDDERYFRASGESCTIVASNDDASQLSIFGMDLAAIEKVWEVTNTMLLLEKGSFRGDLSLGIPCTETDPEQETYPFTGEAMEDAYFRTLTGDQWYNSERIDHDYRRLYFPLIHPLLQQAFEEAVDPPESFWIDIGVSFVKHVDRMLIGRKLFLTSDGLLGLCPKGAENGDQICILLGADVPMILRQEQEKYRLVGESYVHGMMDGEAIHQLEEAMVPFRQFIVR